MRKVHPDTVAILFFGLGLARVDYPLSGAAGPSKFVVLSQKVSGIAPMGLTFPPTAIRGDLWAEIRNKITSLSLSRPTVHVMFQQRDVSSLLRIAEDILFESLQAVAPEYIEQTQNPSGIRIPGWDAKAGG